MAETSDKVMEFVEKEIKKNPDVETQTLYDKAKEVDKGVGKLTLRQFHARYPLQVKRRMAPKKPRRRRPSRQKGPEVNREAIREVLLKFARDVAAAEGAEVIDVIAGVDKYVDEVVKALGKT